jgi:hypothetical protein
MVEKYPKNIVFRVAVILYEKLLKEWYYFKLIITEAKRDAMILSEQLSIDIDIK